MTDWSKYNQIAGFYTAKIASIAYIFILQFWNRMQAKQGRWKELETQTNQQGSNFLSKIGQRDWSVPGRSLGACRTNR